MGSFLHGGFIDREKALKHETKTHLERLLTEPLAGEKVKLVDRYELKWNMYADRTLRPNGTLEDFKWRMEGDYFDLDALKLEAGSADVQPRYRIDLNVQATDTNFDTGPKTAPPTSIRCGCSSSPRATCSSRSARRKKSSARSSMKRSPSSGSAATTTPS